MFTGKHKIGMYSLDIEYNIGKYLYVDRRQ